MYHSFIVEFMWVKGTIMEDNVKPILIDRKIFVENLSIIKIFARIHASSLLP